MALAGGENLTDARPRAKTDESANDAPTASTSKALRPRLTPFSDDREELSEAVRAPRLGLSVTLVGVRDTS